MLYKRNGFIGGTGVDLSKYWGRNQKITCRWKRVAITDEIIGVYQLLGACAWAAPRVYAYDWGLDPGIFPKYTHDLK